MTTVDAAPPRTGEIGSRLGFETLIADTSAALFSAPPDLIDGAIERALAGVREFFRADRCALLSVSTDQDEVRVRLASYSEGVASVPPDLNLAPLFPWSRHTLLEARTPVRVTTIEELPPEADAERAMWKEMPIRSALTIPIETGGVVRHLMLLNTVHDEVHWPDAFVTRLRVMGEMFVGALERQESFRRLRASEARLASGADLAGLAYYEVHYDDKEIFLDGRFRDVCGIPADHETALRPVDFWLEHIHPDDLPTVIEARRQLHDGIAERTEIAYRYRHPVRGDRWIHHLAGVVRRDETGDACVTYGVLRDITEVKRTEEELRDLSRRLIRAHEEERALLARDLHDDLTQRLAVLAIEVGRAEISARGGEHEATLRTVREELARLSEDVHSLAYQLHPSVLTELGLVEALRTECERRGRRGMKIALDLEADAGAPGKDGALCLFRVAQEALNNVRRHSGATNAVVRLRQMDGGILLTVSDRGRGFELQQSGEGRHLGLVSMRERVRLVDGTLDVESAPGEGTTIVAWVPARATSA